jgi:hypothetical protein
VNILCVGPCEKTFLKTQVIDRIEQVGFAAAVATADADYLLAKRKLLLHIIAELGE